MILKEKVYWHDTIEMPTDEHLTDLPPKVDMAVIGGGIPGLSAARQLARRGAKVAVLDSQTIGWGANRQPGAD